MVRMMDEDWPFNKLDTLRRLKDMQQEKVHE